MHLRRTLYRCVNRYWADERLAGLEAARLGGRFNRSGRRAIYLSFHPMTAMNEAKHAGAFASVAMIVVEVNLDRVFDATDPSLLLEYQARLSDLADDTWSQAMNRAGMVKTQALAESLIEAGFTAMIVPSFTPGASDDARNLVIWV